MTKNILGEQILKFRKEAGLTQEELGKSVGVSTQAVSRWECGGTPDVELLPAIADRLHVSVDALFGRQGGEALDLKELLYHAIQNAPKERCMEELLEYSWVMQRACIINQSPECVYASDMLSSLAVSDRGAQENPEHIPSQLGINIDAGFMMQGLVKDMRFSLVLPEAEQGYAAMLKRPEEYVRLFQLLAKPHYLDMLIDIDMRPPQEHFTASLAAARLGIPESLAQEILDELTLHRMVLKLNVADVGGTLSVYQKEPQINLLAFLFFCSQLMRCIGSVDMCIDLRQKPIFSAVPGTGSLVAEWKV